MKVNPNIFRAYDIRGIVEKDITQEFAYRLGRAYAKWATLKKAEITVGHDTRSTGEKYYHALIAGLRDGGIQTHALGMVTTPMVYFSMFHLNLEGSIVVTGSHNPANYNGFKISIGQTTILGDDIQALKKIIESDNTPYTPTPTKDIKKLDIFPAYSTYITENITLSRPLHIVVDAGNGATGPFTSAIYEKLGCKVTSMYCEPDGNFPNHPADPSVEENLKDLRKKVKETGADAGFAFDGDGDRIGVVDNNSNILWGDQLMIVFSRSILSKNPGAIIISEVKCSKNLYAEIEKLGGKPIMWKTGHSIIKKKIRETGALLAGEMSGHIFFADRFFGFDDGTYAGARFLEILSNTKEDSSKLLSNVPKTYCTPEIKIDVDDLKKKAIVDKLITRLQNKHEVIIIDGVRVTFDDGWGLVRPSNTEPKIVMRFEADTPQRLTEIKSYIESELNTVMAKHL